MSESALSSRIKLARQAIGDSGRQQKYIKTIHKKGFSFSSDIEVTALSAKEDASKNQAAILENNVDSNPTFLKPSIAVVPFYNLE